MHYNYIAIEGTVGAGKTSLATRIAKDFNGRLILEEFEGDKNPFLPKFYKEPEKYSFQLEMTFLALRFQQLKDKLGVLDLFHDFIISDYYVAKSLIFSRNNLQEDEYQLFSRFFNIIFSDMPKPELLVYLYSDVERLQRNIRQRAYYQHSCSHQRYWPDHPDRPAWRQYLWPVRSRIWLTRHHPDLFHRRWCPERR